jgi:hypothetical protein
MIKIILVIVPLALLYIFSPKYLKAESVECYTQYGPCPSNVVESLQSLTGLPLLRPLPSASVKSSLAPYPQVKSVSLFRRLPKTIVVSIDLHRPIGQVLSSTSTGPYGLVGDDGTIFSQSPSGQNLPSLLLDSDSLPSSKLSGIQTSALTSLELLSRLTSTMPTGVLSGTDLTASLDSGLQIVLNVERPSDDWYPPLQLILARSKMSSKYPKKIDLRFNHPVLTY